MISVQELGLSILSDKPKSFYILGGSEYGIKDKYVDKLSALYGEKFEYPSVMSVIDMMRTRHLIPLKPALYVVRYDETFVSSLSEAVAEKIKSTNICGTLVCIYSDTKHLTKLDKFLPDYTGVIDSVNEKFIEKYLHQDFPGLDDRSIKIATACAENYGHARTICKSLSVADKDVINKMSVGSLEHLFGCTSASAENDIRLGVASRNFKYLVKQLDVFEGDKASLYYTILQTLIDMEKVLTTKYPNLDIAEYKKFWKIEDIYYMFMNTYQELVDSRSSDVSSNIDSSLTYLFALLTFKDIPSPEALHDF